MFRSSPLQYTIKENIGIQEFVRTIFRDGPLNPEGILKFYKEHPHLFHFHKFSLKKNVFMKSDVLYRRIIVHCGPACILNMKLNSFKNVELEPEIKEKLSLFHKYSEMKHYLKNSVVSLNTTEAQLYNFEIKKRKDGILFVLDLPIELKEILEPDLDNNVNMVTK